MVDPSDVTRFNRSVEELQEFLLFSVLVAGKKATTTAKALERILQKAAGEKPFDYLIQFTVEQLVTILKDCGVGCFSLKSQCIYDLCSGNFDLKTVEAAALERVHGVGCKTARFFILHTRKDAQVAALDTHILHFMRDLGYEKVPASTPGSRKQYRIWEEKFIELADRSQMTIADFDLAIWNAYSKKDCRAKDQLLNLVRRDSQP